ncbi:hypothetical protein MKW98_014901, partial [Papaver atlanticum]
ENMKRTSPRLKAKATNSADNAPSNKATKYGDKVPLEKGKKKKIKTAYKSGLLPLLEMSYYLYKVLKDKPEHVKAFRESLFWGFIELFFKEEPENRPAKDVTTERDAYTKIPQALEMLLGFHDSAVVRKKVQVGFVFNNKVYVPTTDNFVVFFNVQRRFEDAGLKKKLSKVTAHHIKFLHKHFPPIEGKDYKVTRKQIDTVLREAATNGKDPTLFLIFFAMWLCTVFFFTDTGGNFFTQRWFPYLFSMHRVSWPDHIVNYLMDSIKNPKGKDGLKRVPGYTPLLLYWFLEHNNYNQKRQGFEHSTLRFTRWHQLEFCNKLMVEKKDKDGKMVLPEGFIFTDGIREELSPHEQGLTYLKELEEELQIEKDFNNLLYDLLAGERLNAEFIEAENFALQEIFYRIKGRDQFLRKFLADNYFLGSIYEANKNKINLRDDQKKHMADVYKNLQDWEEL